MNRYLSFPAKTIPRTKMLPVIFVLFLVATASAQPCEDINSVDITNGTILKDGSIQDGVLYPPNLVYSKIIDGESKTFGCLCELKNCFRKCCALGFVSVIKNCTEMPHVDGIANSGLKLYDGPNFKSNKSLEEAGFGLMVGKPEGQCYMEDLPWFVQENGELQVEITENNYKSYSPDKYCIDNFIWDDPNNPQLSALICYTPEPATETNNANVSSTCMLISCFFIVLTVAVYACLPRNLHAMVLMAYLLSFLVGFGFMATMQILLLKQSIPAHVCVIFTFIIYFSLLSAFFWLNVMCFDIWYTFSGKRSPAGGPSSAHARFMSYSMYAFGVPTVLTILLAVLEFTVNPNKSLLLPRLALQGCFISGKSKLLYFYGPIVILCVANLIFFVLTALKIADTKRQAQKVLNKKDKQRFSLYIKLFVVMGVNWILEVVSSFFPEALYIWQFTDAYNVLVGLIIFIIFVCKKKTFNLIKDRFRVWRGLPPLSRTQTTSTSLSTRTLSQSKDEMTMHSTISKK